MVQGVYEGDTYVIHSYSWVINIRHKGISVSEIPWRKQFLCDSNFPNIIQNVRPHRHDRCYNDVDAQIHDSTTK